MARERYRPPAGSGGGISLPLTLSALDFDAATFSDPSTLLTSWNQPSVGGDIEVVFAGTLGSVTAGFRPGASWTWALSDIESAFVSGSSFVIGEIYVVDWPKTSTGAQVGMAGTDNGTVAAASGSGHEHYDSGVADERSRGYFATGANGNTGRAGMDYLQVLISPRFGSSGIVAICDGHATAGNFHQDLVGSTAGALSHLVVSVGQELANVSGTFTFRAGALVLPGTGTQSI